MKYSDLEAAAAVLAANPPCFAVTPERYKTLLQVDTIFSEANSDRSAELGQFYRERIDRAIREIAAYDGKTPRMWKLCSSGIIIKDACCTMGIDIADCVRSNARSTVTLTEKHISDLADILDEYYCTHAHSDHIDPRLCDAMAARGKLMVMPRTALKSWIVPTATAAEDFISDRVKTYINWQGSDEVKGLDCAMFLFTLSNGKRVFIRGDIYHRDGFNGCLEHIRAWGETVDYFFGSPYYTSGEAPFGLLEKEFDCRFVPIHEWEFDHRKQDVTGPATQCFEELYNTLASPYAKGKAQFLLWGESIALD
jgi:L-ascorbate metabolism protein UlaG (beta-lactamase superfamily)